MYSGKFAALADDFVPVQRSKRARHSTGSAGGESSPPAPHPSTLPHIQEHRGPGKDEFAGMSMENKMISLFDMIRGITPINYKLDCLTQNIMYSQVTSEVMDSRLKLLEYKSLDVEARLLRGNLIFSGCPETQPSENCLAIIAEIIKTKLNLDDAAAMITRAYRLGRRSVANNMNGTARCRPILASFSNPEITDTILQNARMLANTPYGISRDYPREIREARQELWPDYREARAKYGKRNVKIKFPAALEINGDTVRNLFPDWHKVLRGSRNSNANARIQEKFVRRIEQMGCSQDSNNVDTLLIDESVPDDDQDLVPANAVEDEPVSGDEEQPAQTQPGGYLLQVHQPMQAKPSKPSQTSTNKSKGKAPVNGKQKVKSSSVKVTSTPTSRTNSPARTSARQSPRVSSPRPELDQ